MKITIPLETIVAVAPHINDMLLICGSDKTFKDLTYEEKETIFTEMVKGMVRLNDGEENLIEQYVPEIVLTNILKEKP